MVDLPEQGAAPLIRDGRIDLQPIGLEHAPLSDLYYYLMTATWGRFIGLFVTLYLALNAVFAFLYMFLGATIQNARPHSFLDAFFFSIQTMSTIGFGHLSPGNLYADAVVAVESIVGLLGMAMVTGLIFAKFARPKARIIFSKSAVITSRSGVRSLIFRVANERTNHIIEAKMRASFTYLETTPEGEVIRRFVPLELERPETPLFALAWQGTHAIGPGSPLWEHTEETLRTRNAELLVTVAGIDQDLAHPIHAAHSYNVSEIVHGCRLADMFETAPDGSRLVDFRKFHDFTRNTDLDSPNSAS